MNKEDYKDSRRNLKRAAEVHGGDAHKMVTAAELVAIGHSYAQAAKEVGVHVNTVRKWSKKTAFNNHRDLIESAMYDEIKSRIPGTVSKALDAIHKGLDSDDPKLAATTGLGILKIMGAKSTNELISSEGREETWTEERLDAELEFYKQEIGKLLKGPEVIDIGVDHDNS